MFDIKSREQIYNKDNSKLSNKFICKLMKKSLVLAKEEKWVGLTFINKQGHLFMKGLIVFMKGLSFKSATHVSIVFKPYYMPR